MLNANSLAADMKNAVNNKTDASLALQSLSSAISDYVKTNAQIMFNWVAVSPTGVPDPVTVASGRFSMFPVTLTPSGTSDYQASQQQFASQCNSGFSLSVYNITDAGFSTAPAIAGTSIPLVLSIPETADFDTAINTLASNIVDWIKQQILSVPVSGSHGVYVGAGLATSIV